MKDAGIIVRVPLASGLLTGKFIELNLNASALSPIPDEIMQEIEKIYDEEIKPLVHQRW